MKCKKVIMVILFAVYASAMLWLLFGQRLDRDFSGTYGEQLRSMPLPLQTIVQYMRIIITRKPPDVIPHAWQNLVGNVVMFIPIGIFLPFFFKTCRTAKRTFFIGFLIVAGIELTQFFTLLGSLDFDDFMLNCIGILLGYSFWRILPEKIRD